MEASKNKDMKKEKEGLVNVSSGSSGCSKQQEGIIDEKKRRRMESNRESARRSRQKKQQHLDDLINQVGGLTRQNGDIEKKIEDLNGMYANCEAENRVLRAEKHRLAAKLDSLESIIEINKVFNRSSSSSSSSSSNGGGYYNYNYNVNVNGGEQCMYGVNNGYGYGHGQTTMMKPWQLPSPSMPLIPSSGLHYSSSSSFKF